MIEKGERRQPRGPSTGVRYAASLLFILSALMLAIAARPAIELNAFNLLQGAVFLSAWFGGLGPGMLASVLSIAVLDYFFLTPRFAFKFAWVDDGIDLVVFAALTFIISSLSARLKEAKAHLERAHEELEHRIEERTEQLSSEITSRLEAEKAILEISHREQERMGQDLHDGLCQTLAAIRLIAETLNKRLTKQSLPETAYVDKMEGLLSEALARTDSISRGLYPVELEKNGLTAALQELAHNMSQTHGVDCRFTTRQTILLENGAVATHLFRIAQEVVMNAIKGGKAQRIGIRLFQWKSRIVLAVSDDGLGFDPLNMRKGMGLNIINYRARIMNAAFNLRPRRRKGTLAVCSLDTDIAERISEYAF